MKIEQRQYRETRESIDEVVGEAFEDTGYIHRRAYAEKTAEEELQKLFLARLDVRSRIEELKRNRASLRARKVDVESKIAFLSEFDAKLMQKEEEVSRSMIES